MRWKDRRHRDGWEAEVAAGRRLTAAGWRVLAHRWAFGRHDLDLIVRRGALVAFVEVKRRLGGSCGSGVESVGPRKRRIVERLAWAWILRHGAGEDQYRFDVIAVDGPPGRERWSHVEDAWRPGWR